MPNVGSNAEQASYAPLAIGTGVDVHATAAGRDCWMAGLLWPGVDGCEGFSDGDVVAHAICDALLSAYGAGDLGEVFGLDDPSWADAHGVPMIEHVVRTYGTDYVVINVAVQMLGNAPRIASRRREAQLVLGAAVGGSVSLSATTTDHLGLTGRGEGVAAIANTLIRRSG